MPELPEVEVTRLGLLPHITGRRIVRAVVRHHGLRWCRSLRRIGDAESGEPRNQ